MLLSDSHMTMVVGIDVHVTTSPPFNPLHPYIGIVLDVADYIPFLGTNVTVNGLKRGVSDTGGIIHPADAHPACGTVPDVSHDWSREHELLRLGDGLLRRHPHESERTTCRLSADTINFDGAKLSNVIMPGTISRAYARS